MGEEWELEKKRALQRLKRDIEIGYIDVKMINVLNAINRIDDLYTTSSCSGRIMVIDAQWPWEREDVYTVLKTHDKVSSEEIKNALKARPMYRLWLLARGPILHVISRDFSKAIKFLRLAKEAGFKHSGILDKTSVGLLIELVSGSQISIPIYSEDKLLIDVSSLDKLIDIANEVLEDGWKRLDCLHEKISRWQI